MQGAQLCQHKMLHDSNQEPENARISKKRRQSFIGCSPQNATFLCSNQKEKEKTKLKPINNQIPKQKLQKNQIALRFNSN